MSGHNTFTTYMELQMDFSLQTKLENLFNQKRRLLFWVNIVIIRIQKKIVAVSFFQDKFWQFVLTK